MFQVRVTGDALEVRFTPLSRTTAVAGG